jgi:hypothetical protein
MNHSFSWRKVGEVTVIITVIYAVSTPILDNSLDPASTLQVVGPYVILFALSSKVLEKVSEGESSNNFYQ